MTCFRPADDTEIGQDSIGRPAETIADAHLIDASGLYTATRAGLPRHLPREELRLDVDGRFPQLTVSGTIRQGTAGRLHWVADLTPADRQRWTGGIWHKDGTGALLPHTNIDVSVHRTPFGIGQTASVTFSGGGVADRTCLYAYASRYFHPIEFEADIVAGAAAPGESPSVESVLRRAGFNVGRSGGDGVIPIAVGADVAWSDMELHDAMQAYWSRFASRAPHSMWILTAARHESGTGLLGMRFDDVGPDRRPAVALFNEAFAGGAPGDPDASARSRTRAACREMAQAFGADTAWPCPPGATRRAPPAAFADLHVRFEDVELLSLRHAPERLAAEAGRLDGSGFEQAASPHPALRLTLRASRVTALFEFLEPVMLELELTNESDRPMPVDEGLMAADDALAVAIRRDRGPARRWQPYACRRRSPAPRMLAPGKSVCRSLFAAAGRNGWDLAEPGPYEVQAALSIGGEQVVSNPFRLRIAMPRSFEEEILAQDVFTDAVGRILVFGGSRALRAGNDTLEEVIRRLRDRRIATHAHLALAWPLARDGKRLALGDGPCWMASAAEAGGRIEIAAADAAAARRGLTAALMRDPGQAAETLGHTAYKDHVDRFALWLEEQGDAAGAAACRKRMQETLARREAADGAPQQITQARGAGAAKPRRRQVYR